MVVTTMTLTTATTPTLALATTILPLAPAATTIPTMSLQLSKLLSTSVAIASRA